jgi:hypothetical protein
LRKVISTACYVRGTECSTALTGLIFWDSFYTQGSRPGLITYAPMGHEDPLTDPPQADGSFIGTLIRIRNLNSAAYETRSPLGRGLNRIRRVS